MTQAHDEQVLSAVQGLFQGKDGWKELLEWLLNEAMKAEVSEHLCAERHERSGRRKGYRNGTKKRGIKARVGDLTLTVPQTRGCEPYHPSMFNRWQRSERALLVACAEMYFQGVSTRKVQEVLEVMSGTSLSSMTVSRVAGELDEKLDEFRSRRLDGHIYPYLVVDARYEKVRVNGHVASQAVMVVAGYNEEGRREVLDWRLGDSESEETWGELFRDLKDRGLRGVEFVTSDAHSGIRKALARHFQGVAWQRCHVHFQREALRKVSSKRFLEVRSELAAVFKPMEREECLRRGEEMACRWEGRYPKLAKMIREGLEDTLTVLSLPSSHQKRLKSTNALERVMREIKRRTRVVSVFPNVGSCDRLVGAHLLELHEKWVSADRPVLKMYLLEDTRVRRGRRMRGVA